MYRLLIFFISLQCEMTPCDILGVLHVKCCFVFFSNISPDIVYFVSITNNLSIVKDPCFKSFHINDNFILLKQNTDNCPLLLISPSRSTVVIKRFMHAHPVQVLNFNTAVIIHLYREHFQFR